MISATPRLTDAASAFSVITGSSDITISSAISSASGFLSFVFTIVEYLHKKSLHDNSLCLQRCPMPNTFTFSPVANNPVLTNVTRRFFALDNIT